MPLYEYECPKCGRFEVIQKFSDEPLTCDPDCAEKGCPKKATRLMSESAFHLKGGGWYKTDYAGSGSSSTGSKNNSTATSTPAEGGDSSSTKKDEKKSIAKVNGGCGSGCGCH